MKAGFFKKKPFKERLRDTGFLLKNSFVIIGEDKDIKTPTIHMIILSVIISIFFYMSILMFFLGKLLIGFLLFFSFFILIFFRFFYDVRQKADQSWIVYNTIKGENVDYSDAHFHTKTQKGNLRKVAFVDCLVKHSCNKAGGGKVGILVGLFLAFLSEVWDLLSHYMLPAIVIEKKNLKEMVSNIKHLKNNIPATLVGVFGLDFVGNVIGSLFSGLFFILFFSSLGIGHLVSMFTDFAVVTLFNFSFSWVPIVLIFFIFSIVKIIYRKIIESIKVIYFTIFYVSIMKPMEIVPDKREQLTNYLLMERKEFVSEQKVSPNDEYINQLSSYISQYLTSGYSEEDVRNFLVSKGYSLEDVELAVSRLR